MERDGYGGADGEMEMREVGDKRDRDREMRGRWRERWVLLGLHWSIPPV